MKTEKKLEGANELSRQLASEVIVQEIIMNPEEQLIELIHNSKKFTTEEDF